jgi:hypothetical protein
MHRAILHALQGGAGGAHSFMIELTAVAEAVRRIALLGETVAQLASPILMGRANGKTSAYQVQAFRPGGLVPPIAEHTLEVLPPENGWDGVYMGQPDVP